jgi:hypothetical protein
MTVPNRTITIKNGGNGVAPTGNTRYRAIIGTSSTGSIDTPTVCTAPNQVSDTFGIGPLVDAAKYELDAAGGVVVVIRTKDSVAGAITTGTAYESGSGTCTCTGTPNNRYLLTVQITTAGNLGVAVFKYSLDDGPGDDEKNWSLPVVVPSGATYVIPNTGLTLTFGGTAFAVGDEFYFSTTAPSAQSADLQASFVALQAYTGKWEWVHVVGETTAAIAAAVDTKMTSCATAHKYRYAILEAVDVDMISTVTATGTTPPTVTIAGIPRGSWSMQIDITTGGVLGTAAFKYSIDNGNTWSDAITTTVGTGINPLGNTGLTATFASGTYNTDNLYTFNTWDKNEAAWVTALQSAYSSTSSDRVMVCAGFGEVTLTDGKVQRRPIGWGVSAIQARKTISDDTGQVIDAGPLPSFITISHDEAAVPGLDDSRFCTSRYWDKIAGCYVNQGRTLAIAGSDYDLIQYREVMDAACEALDTAMVIEVNRKIKVDSATGYILETEARALENKFLSALKSAIVAPGHASSVTCSIRRADNILSTRQINVDLEVIGVAYAKTIAATIGYKNPAITVA